ncbi:MAG: hypothetical protein IPI23_12550 [Bacteroidetes bacterium]|nr:hypothetical protein [Bacteroidota bacterium]
MKKISSFISVLILFAFLFMQLSGILHEKRPNSQTFDSDHTSIEQAHQINHSEAALSDPNISFSFLSKSESPIKLMVVAPSLTSNLEASFYKDYLSTFSDQISTFFNSNQLFSLFLKILI